MRFAEQPSSGDEAMRVPLPTRMRERAAMLKARNPRRASGEFPRCCGWSLECSSGGASVMCAGGSYGLRSKTHLAAYWDAMPLQVRAMAIFCDACPCSVAWVTRASDLQQRRAAVAAGVANARAATTDARGGSRSIGEHHRMLAPTGGASAAAAVATGAAAPTGSIALAPVSFAAAPAVSGAGALHAPQRLTRALSANGAADGGAGSSGGGSTATVAAVGGFASAVGSAAGDGDGDGAASCGDREAVASDGAMSESVAVPSRGDDDAAFEVRFMPLRSGDADAADPWPWCLVGMSGVDVVESLFISPLGCVCCGVRAMSRCSGRCVERVCMCVLQADTQGRRSGCS